MSETKKAIYRLKIAWLDLRLAMAESRVVNAKIAEMKARHRLLSARNDTEGSEMKTTKPTEKK